MDRIDAAEDGVAGGAAGAYAGGRRYKISLPDTGANRVNLTDMHAGRIGRDGRPRGEWLIRVDNPHPGNTHPVGGHFDHININSNAIRGRPDPHIRIPPRAVAAAEATAKTLKTANKVLLPVAIAVDAISIGRGIKNDYDNGTTRNTGEAVAGVAGAWVGGGGGAALGALAGTAVCPGVGTLVGTIIGGIGGGVGGGIGAEKATQVYGDYKGWDIEEKTCQRCGKRFKSRKYSGERSDYCLVCR